MWGNNPDPKEYFGFSKEELAEQLKQGAEAKAKLAEMDATISTGFSELRASLEALKTPPPPEPKNQNEVKAPANFFENPDQAFADRMNPLAIHSMTNAARLELLEARARFPREFQLWGEELNKMIESDTLSNRGNPVFYKNIVDMVRGRHASEIEESARKGTSLFTEPVSGGLPGGSNDDPKAAAVARLTTEQLSYAKRFGMTPEEFANNLAYVESSYGHTKGSSHVQ
jgi:hypothetical protein